MLLLSSIAFAGSTYEVEVGIPMSGNNLDSSGHPAVIRVFPDVLPSSMNVTVQTSSPWISCRSSGQDVLVEVQVHDTALGSMPSSATCSYQGTDLHVFPVPSAEFAWLESAKTVDFNQELLISTAANSSGYAVYSLPGSLGYTEGIGQAYDSNGSPWTGVHCETREGPQGDWFVRVQLDQGHQQGKGSCEVPSKTPIPHMLSMAILAP